MTSTAHAAGRRLTAVLLPALAAAGDAGAGAARATLALTDEMKRTVKVKDATLKRIRAVLPDARVVELVGTIPGYDMVSRFVVASGVEIEQPSPRP